MSSSDKVRTFLTSINDLTTIEALEQRFLFLVRELGYAFAAYYRLYGGGRAHGGAFLFGERRPEWLDLYRCKRFAGRDPRIVLALRSSSAFTWDEALALIPLASGAEVVEGARRLMAMDGLVSPIRYGVDEQGMCVLYADHRIQLCPYERWLMQGLCEAFSRRGLQILKTGTEDRFPSLTAREAECLQWVAAGHSDQEIAAALGRSSNTVHTQWSRCGASCGPARAPRW